MQLSGETLGPELQRSPPPILFDQTETIPSKLAVIPKYHDLEYTPVNTTHSEILLHHGYRVQIATTSLSLLNDVMLTKDHIILTGPWHPLMSVNV